MSREGYTASMPTLNISTSVLGEYKIKAMDVPAVYLPKQNTPTRSISPQIDRLR